MNVGEISQSERREFTDAASGRRVVQLTRGDCFDYPLYYFIPSMTRDSKSIVFYRHHLDRDEVQHYRLDVETGRTVLLTDAHTPNALWRPWLQKPGAGVRDQLSAFSMATGELFYFDSNDLRAVEIHSLRDRVVHHVPDGRVPCGLTGVSPDGRHFVFPHADRAWWERNLTSGPERHTAEDCRVEVVETQTGSARTLLHLNAWITHCNFYDDRRVLFCHAPTHRAILMTDLRGGWFADLRTPDASGMTCHYQATRRGIVYEVLPAHLGICDPETFAREEYPLATHRVHHVGRDPDARLWFYEAPVQGDVRGICFLPRLSPSEPNPAQVILGPTPMYWLGQRSHIHPSVTPDRRHILFTGGDARNQTNHLCLLDISGLEDTRWRWPRSAARD